MQVHDLSLKWLEAFRAVARAGSVKAAADRMGLSASTVSQHIKCLEDAVGTPLLRHGERPMRPTADGEVLLGSIEAGFLSLEQGLSAIGGTDLTRLARRITLASIEDFESAVIPPLAQTLLKALPDCRLTVLTRPSHDVARLIATETADLGLAATSDQTLDGVMELPVLRDPYLLVVPVDGPDTPETYLAGDSGQAFLRYSAGQMISQRIAAQLSRSRLSLPSRIECESTANLLGLVADGEAWTITTALNFARTARLHDRLRLLPYPAGDFSREIALIHKPSQMPELVDLVAGQLRPLLQQAVIDPTVAQAPWLRDAFHLLPSGSE
ncbi:MAG: LysR family transcriptional regulator [Paracoccaceae bacterium]|nr:LysR family transcriptional regulator [Paracoccaceae bacterium]